MSRFGKKVTYVVIGDGRDEEIAAKQVIMVKKMWEFQDLFFSFVYALERKRNSKENLNLTSVYFLGSFIYLER